MEGDFMTSQVGDLSFNIQQTTPQLPTAIQLEEIEQEPEIQFEEVIKHDTSTMYGKIETMIQEVLAKHPEYKRDDLIIDIHPKKTDEGFYILGTTTIKNPKDGSKEITYWKGTAVLEIKVKNSQQEEMLLKSQEDLVQTKATDAGEGMALIEGYCKVTQEACQPSTQRILLNGKINHTRAVEELKKGGLNIITAKSGNKISAKKILLGKETEKENDLQKKVEINFPESKSIYKVDNNKYIINNELNSEIIDYSSDNVLESEMENRYLLEEEYHAHSISMLDEKNILSCFERQEISPTSFLQYIHKKDEKKYQEDFLPLRARFFNANEEFTSEFKKFLEQDRARLSTESVQNDQLTVAKQLKAQSELKKIKELKARLKETQDKLHEIEQININEKIVEMKTGEIENSANTQKEIAEKLLHELHKNDSIFREFLSTKEVIIESSAKSNSEDTLQLIEGANPLQLMQEHYAQRKESLEKEEVRWNQEYSRLNHQLFEEQRPIVNAKRKIVEIQKEFQRRETQLIALQNAAKQTPILKEHQEAIGKELANTQKLLNNVSGLIEKLSF